MNRQLIAKTFWAFIAMLMLTGTVVLPVANAHAEVVDRIVARVHNEIITLHEVRQAMTPYLMQQGLDPRQFDRAMQRPELYKEVLNDMVERTLLMHEAKKLELSVSEQEVEQWLAFTRQQQNMSENDFKTVIAQYGLEYDEYREMIRENLLRMRLINVKVGSAINISDADVDAEYRQRFGNAAVTESFRTIYHILFQPASNSEEDVAQAHQKAQSVYERLQQGEDFMALAETENPAALAGSKGYLGTFKQGDLDPEFEAAAFQVDEGELSPVVQTRFGFHIIHVTTVEERASANVEQQRSQIREELYQRQMERQLKQYVQGLKTRNFVDIRL